MQTLLRQSPGLATTSSFGRMLQKLMNGESQQDFAAKIRVSPTTLNNWLTGKVGRPQDKNLEGLSELTKLPIAKLRAMMFSSDQLADEMDEVFSKPLADPAGIFNKVTDECCRHLNGIRSNLTMEEPGYSDLVRKIDALMTVLFQFRQPATAVKPTEEAAL